MAYKVEPAREVHQKITQESVKAWTSAPAEIEEHLESNIHTGTLLLQGYNVGEDMIDGSFEEDATLNFFNHFFDPDQPQSGDYNAGLIPWVTESSYRRARNYWLTRVLPYYIEGDIEQSYYWLGAVAHLLEDASVPAHVHLDPHPPFVPSQEDFIEQYTASNAVFNNFNGNTVGSFYKYENLPNTANLNWGDIDSNYPEVKNLFRLFWYTAQKAQYFASNHRDGNSTYVKKSGGAPITFSPSLWTGDGVNIISNQQDVEANVQTIKDAVIPHAMRATAGLYRLFWDSVHIDWPFFHHDVQRTGFTHLKGDLTPNNLQDINIVLSSTDDYVSRVTIADLDGNGLQEAVVTTFKQGVGGNVYSVEKSGNDNVAVKWTYNAGFTIGSPALSNIDSDKQKEIIYSTNDGKLHRLDVGSSGSSVSHDTLFTLVSRTDPDIGLSYKGNIRNTAIADLDHDGNKEIIFADFLDYLNEDWPAKLYVLNRNGNLLASKTIGNGGANGAVAIANVDSDTNLEIFVPTTYGMKVYDYTTSLTLNQKWANTDGAITGSPVVADADSDGDLEVIYVTTDASGICDPTKSCTNEITVRNAETGSLQNGISLSQLDTRITPAVANIDSDDRFEAVIAAANDDTTTFGSIKAYDLVSDSLQWTYNDGGNLEISSISPDIADVNGDGDFDIIYAENNDMNVYILEDDGSLWKKYSFAGVIGSSLAIGDLDNDRRAEIAVKHAGSPTTILSHLTATNNIPDLTVSSVPVYNENSAIDLSTYVSTSDYNNDTLQMIYEPPFNSTGQWQGGCKSAGQHLIFVETIDQGNLSDIEPITLQINPTCPILDEFERIIAEEGESVIITAKATDPNSDAMSYTINDTRFSQNNNIFTWPTKIGDAGNYSFIVNVTDAGGNRDSLPILVNVFAKESNVLKKFSDGSTTKILTFSTAGETQSATLRLPKGSKIQYTNFKMEGLSP